jgi:putative hydrolase of the HAD superfamily
LVHLGIKAVLFDLDGTLLDRDSSLALFVSDQYDRHAQLQVVEKDLFVGRFIELDHHGYVWKDKVYQQLVEEFSLQGLQWTDLLSDYVSQFQRHCIGFPHMKQMLTELKNNGVKLALVSNGYGQFQYDNFHALGVTDLFNEVLISEWEGIRKPDPEIFIRALSRLQVAAAEALFVGDHPINDIQASRNAGIKAVWKRSEQSEHDIAADAVIDDLEELTQIVLFGTGGVAPVI